MDDSKFDSFLNDVMTQKNSGRPAPNSYDIELGDKKEEIIALWTEHKISRRIIYDSLIKAGIMSKDRPFKGFSGWMTKAIKRSNEANTDISDNQPKVYRVEDS